MALPQIHIPDDDFNALTIDGRSFNSVTEAAKSLNGDAQAAEELDAAIAQWTAARLQAVVFAKEAQASAEKIVSDRQEEYAAAVRQVPDLEERVRQAENDSETAKDEARVLREEVKALQGHLETARSEYTALCSQMEKTVEELRIARLPTDEQKREIIARERAAVAERLRLLDEAEATIGQTGESGEK